MRRSNTFAAVLTLGLLGLLTACTPADEQRLALAVRDGRPVAVLVGCGAGHLLSARVAVYEDSPGSSPSNVLVSWSATGPGEQGVAEVPLLGRLPARWTAETGPEPSASPGVPRVERLTELRPGTRYGLSGSESGKLMTVRFTTADLDRIGPDQVLTAEDAWTSTLTTRAEFERRARGFCTP